MNLDDGSSESMQYLDHWSQPGLGLETVKQLSEDSFQKHHIFATCRDPDGPKSEVSSK